MKPIKKILVAIAPSEHAEGVFNYAAQVAAPFNAGLIVASIINSRDVDAVETITSMGYKVNGEDYVQSIKEDRKQVIGEIVGKSSFPQEKIHAVVKVGNPIEELLKIVEKESVDMIVMGPKGRTNLEYVIIGSVAEKMFRRSPVPILSYRDEKHAERLKEHFRLF